MTDPSTTGPAAGRPTTIVQLPDHPTGSWAEDLVDHAVEKIDAALARTGRPVLHSRLRILRHRDPARDCPVVARLSVDLGGHVLHVHTEAATARAAVDAVVDRLARRIERDTRYRTAPIAHATHRPQRP
jgi:ribosome-associated translation inhibitor RaiA